MRDETRSTRLPPAASARRIRRPVAALLLALALAGCAATTADYGSSTPPGSWRGNSDLYHTRPNTTQFGG